MAPFFTFLFVALLLVSELTATVAPTFTVYVGGNDPTASCFELNGITGQVTLKSRSNAGLNPCYLAWDPTHRFMYALNEVSPGKISAFTINQSTGALTKINETPVVLNAGRPNQLRLGAACHIACHPSGKWIFTTYYNSGHVVVHAVRPDGGIGALATSLIAGTNAHQAVMNSTGTMLFVPCLGSNYVAQYAVNFVIGNPRTNTPQSLSLTPKNPERASSIPDLGPRHLAFSPNGTTAYGINENSNSITSYAIDPVTKLLSRDSAIKTIPLSFTGKNYPAHVLVSPDGKFVYGSNRGHDSIAVFATNSRNRSLRLVAYETGNLTIKRPRDFGMTPDGSWIIVANQDNIVANQNNSTLTVLKVNKTTGRLTQTSTVSVPAHPTFVGIMRSLHSIVAVQNVTN